MVFLLCWIHDRVERGDQGRASRRVLQIVALEHRLDGKVAELAGAACTPGAELVAEYLEKVLDVVAGRGGRVVLEERMVEFEALNLAAAEEAVLTNVEVEVFERAVAEADDGILLADRAFGVVTGRLGRGQAVQNGQPDYGLRL